LFLYYLFIKAMIYTKRHNLSIYFLFNLIKRDYLILNTWQQFTKLYILVNQIIKIHVNYTKINKKHINLSIL